MMNMRKETWEKGKRRMEIVHAIRRQRAERRQEAKESNKQTSLPIAHCHHPINESKT